jgi:hypothetical protein
MTRIVRTSYRYKRPPKRKKPVTVEGPAVITGKSSRRPADSQVTAEVISLVPRRRDGATKSTTAVDAPRDRPVTGSILTVRRKGARIIPPRPAAQNAGGAPAPRRCRRRHVARAGTPGRREACQHTEDLYILAFATVFAILLIGFASMFHS